MRRTRIVGIGLIAGIALCWSLFAGYVEWSLDRQDERVRELGGRALDRVLEANIASTGADRSRLAVVRADAVDWLGKLPAATRFDVALLDPPYDFAAWDALLAALPAGLAVIESNREVMEEAKAAGAWELIRHRRYGATVVTMVRRLATA